MSRDEEINNYIKSLIDKGINLEDYNDNTSIQMIIDACANKYEENRNIMNKVFLLFKQYFPNLKAIVPITSKPYVIIRLIPSLTQKQIRDNNVSNNGQTDFILKSDGSIQFSKNNLFFSVAKKSRLVFEQEDFLKELFLYIKSSDFPYKINIETSDKIFSTFIANEQISSLNSSNGIVFFVHNFNEKNDKVVGIDPHTKHILLKHNKKDLFIFNNNILVPNSSVPKILKRHVIKEKEIYFQK